MSGSRTVTFTHHLQSLYVFDAATGASHPFLPSSTEIILLYPCRPQDETSSPNLEKHRGCYRRNQEHL